MTDQLNSPRTTRARSDAVVLFIQEMFVDLFGILIPGFCFIIFLVISIGFSSVDLIQEIGHVRHLQGIRDFFHNNTFISFVSLVMVSYVIGHLFFRQDPKYPDLKSIAKLPEADLVSGCVRTRARDERAQFPYAYLKTYLDERGFFDLSKYVEWEGSDFENGNDLRKRRSKHMINKLKLSIKEHSSRLFFDVIKNEAHIRLMSSIWYLCKTLFVISSLGIALSLIANSIAASRSGIFPIPYVESLVFSTGVFGGALLVKFSVEKFFHYQRVREIVFVLHAWHLVEIRNSESEKAKINKSKKEGR